MMPAIIFTRKILCTRTSNFTHALRVSPSFCHMANEILFPDYLHYKENSYHDPLQKTHRSGMASHPQGYQVSAELPVGEKNPIHHQKKSIAQDKLI